jgi:hypothetical protein
MSFGTHGLLTRLKATELLHRWNFRPSAPIGQAAPVVTEAQWLERYLENRKDGLHGLNNECA